VEFGSGGSEGALIRCQSLLLHLYLHHSRLNGLFSLFCLLLALLDLRLDMLTICDQSSQVIALQLRCKVSAMLFYCHDVGLLGLQLGLQVLDLLLLTLNGLLLSHRVR
jgi:hypothetical protein